MTGTRLETVIILFIVSESKKTRILSQLEARDHQTIHAATQAHLSGQGYPEQSSRMENRMIKIPEQHNRRASSRKSYGWLVFLGILACYALLIIPTVDRLGIGWDEATDLVIAQAYQTPRGMLLGIPWDSSQTRLPMFTVALVFRLFGTSNLLLARFTTVLVGGLTLLGIFVYGKERFNLATGLLAAGLLAINPFFLSFARLAFTESDIYLACTLIWLLVAVSRLQERPSLGWAALSGVLLSLAISSKATALVIVPVACLSFLMSQAFPHKSAVNPRVNDLDSMPALSVWFWSGWVTMTMLVGVLTSRQLDAGDHPRILHLFNYGLVCLGWLITLVWVVRHRNSTAPPIALVAFIAGFSILTFVLFPPEHLGNSGIIRELISRADQEMTFSLGFVMELAALHAFTIFLKSTPVLGLGLLAGFVISLTQWRRRELTLPLLVATAYGLAILLLPLGQTFYTIPLLPILSLLAADQLLRLVLNRRKISFALILGLFWWGVEMKQCYPDYHLNGYQWVGARPFFGRSSIGYRSIVYVPLDGVQQVLEWLNVHAENGQTAQLYIEPWYIVNVLAPDPVYQLTDGFKDNLDAKPDYVVTHIVFSIWQGEGSDTPQGDVFRHPFDVDTLQREYEQVFSVQRAFDLEVASIWRRK
jgi:hypothetical protein